MARVIITARVHDPEEWEKRFRTHGELFRRMSLSSVHFATTTEGEVAIYLQPDDLDRFLEMQDSPEIAEAMEHDGVLGETVKVYVLDKELSF